MFRKLVCAIEWVVCSLLLCGILSGFAAMESPARQKIDSIEETNASNAVEAGVSVSAPDRASAQALSVGGSVRGVNVEALEQGNPNTSGAVAINKGNCLNASEHVWDNGVIVLAPSCERTGIVEYTCSVCGKTCKLPVPVLGHNYGEWHDSGNGVQIRICERCGYIQEREVIDLNSER